MIDAKSLIDMLESSFDGIWITDGQGIVLYANSANATLLGVSKEELLGKSTQHFLDKRVFANSAILDAIQQKKRVSTLPLLDLCQARRRPR